MNRKKLNIIKKFLGVSEWTLKEDRDKFPNSIFVFNNGKIIMEYDEETEELVYSHVFLHLKINSLFGYRYEKNKRLVRFLIEKTFRWKIVGSALDIGEDYLNKRKNILNNKKTTKQ